MWSLLREQFVENAYSSLRASAPARLAGAGSFTPIGVANPSSLHSRSKIAFRENKG